MNKVDWKPGTMIYPLPAVMVSLGESEEEYNIITIAWTGTLCTNPPLCYISVRPERHSHTILLRTREFVINLTTRALAHATDWCGGRTYRKFDKIKLMQLLLTSSRTYRCLALRRKATDVVRLIVHSDLVSPYMFALPAWSISVLRISRQAVFSRPEDQGLNII